MFSSTFGVHMLNYRQLLSIVNHLMDTTARCRLTGLMQRSMWTDHAHAEGPNTSNDSALKSRLSLYAATSMLNSYLV